MESDGIDAALGDSLRVGLMVAGRLGEQLARLREGQLRQAEATRAQELRELQSRFDAERLVARAQVAQANQSQWWEHAKPADIVDAWQTANAWQQHDLDIERAAERIRVEVKERYGIDPRNLNAAPAQVKEHLQNVIDASKAADEHRTQAKRDEMLAAQMVLDADRKDRDAESGLVNDADVARDQSASVRLEAASLTENANGNRNDADRYEGIGDKEARRAKQVADRGQAFPAADATKIKAVKNRKQPKRSAPTPTKQQSISR